MLPSTIKRRAAMKSIVDIVRRWPSRKAKAWVEAIIPKACSHPSVLAVVAFGAAVRTTRFTADIDLLVIYDHEKPNFEGRPIDVDIRWYERNKAESFIREGQELLGWVVRYGELLCERDGYWTEIREEWVDQMPFPSAEVAEQRVERAWRLYRELSEMGDEDAAQEQGVVALTQQARAKLIRQHVYPASRPELPEQLRAINEVELAKKLEAALRERERASAISESGNKKRGRGPVFDCQPMASQAELDAAADRPRE